MAMSMITKGDLKKVIEHKENKLRQLLQEIKQYEKIISLSKRKKLRGYKKVQRLKRKFLLPTTSSQKEFKRNKEVQGDCFDYLLKAMKKLYCDFQTSKMNIKEYLEKDDNGKKDRIKKLKADYIHNIDKTSLLNRKKRESCTKLNPKRKASLIYQKTTKPKLIPGPKHKRRSSSCDSSTTTDSTEINYPALKYKFLNKYANRQDSSLKLEAKPNTTSINEILKEQQFPGLDKYRVKPNRLQPSVNSSPVLACEAVSSHNNFNHYGNLFESIVYNQLRSSVENSLTNVQHRRDHMTEDIHNAVMLGHAKNSLYDQKMNNAIRNLVQLLDN